MNTWEVKHLKISTKGRYALRLMIYIATHSNGKPVSIKDISKNEDISDKYLEQIISILNSGGLVRSVRGPLLHLWLMAKFIRCDMRRCRYNHHRRPLQQPAKSRRRILYLTDRYRFFLITIFKALPSLPLISISCLLQDYYRMR